MSAHRLVLPLLAIVLTATGCQQAGDFAVAHAVVPTFGPCAGPMDSVRTDRGEPWKTVVGDEEDRGEGTLTSDHEWGYLLFDPSGAERQDSLHVVHFRWGRDATWCEVRERAARRLHSRLTTPWEVD